jgi:CheY-like chemotaxis protein
MLGRILGEHINLTVDCAVVPLLIRADEGMVEQVLLNLAVNARDAMPKGGKLGITTGRADFDSAAERDQAPARSGPFVWLAVSDTGTGIAPEILPRIFEPFFTTKEVGKGTGLGLATVYSIMQQHGGWVTVESKVGQGTTFRAYFPQVTATTAKAPAASLAAHLPGGHEGILLVEDELTVRVAAEQTLTDLGYRVFSAASALPALQLWEEHQHRIDLLLTDLVMPDGINGRELAQRLQTLERALPVVYMSGYSHEAAGRDFPLKEGQNYLSKPFDVTALAKIVRASLDRRNTKDPFPAIAV